MCSVNGVLVLGCGQGMRDRNKETDEGEGKRGRRQEDIETWRKGAKRRRQPRPGSQVGVQTSLWM